MMKRIVYVGTGLAGKRTSLCSVFAHSGTEYSVESFEKEERVLSWPAGIYQETRTFLMSVGSLRSWLAFGRPEEAMKRANLATEMRRLPEASGLIFVIDSQDARFEADVWYLDRLAGDLAYFGCDVTEIPIVFQANKRDLTGICSMEKIRESFHVDRCAYIESIATKGVGTTETLAALVKLIEAGMKE